MSQEMTASELTGRPQYYRDMLLSAQFDQVFLPTLSNNNTMLSREEFAAKLVQDLHCSRLMRLSRIIRNTQLDRRQRQQAGRDLIADLRNIYQNVLEDDAMNDFNTLPDLSLTVRAVVNPLLELSLSLAAMEAGWQDITCSHSSRYGDALLIGATTQNNVVLTGSYGQLDLGKMRVSVAMAPHTNLDRTHDLIWVQALTPNPCASNANVVHPNVNYHGMSEYGGRLCFGEGAAAIAAAFRRCDILSIFDVVRNILHTPSENPYAFPEFWHYVRTTCAHLMPAEYYDHTRSVCGCCGSSICWTCFTICRCCGRGICGNCGYYISREELSRSSRQYELNLPTYFREGMYAEWLRYTTSTPAQQREYSHVPPLPPIPGNGGESWLACRNCYNVAIHGLFGNIVAVVEPHPWAKQIDSDAEPPSLDSFYYRPVGRPAPAATPVNTPGPAAAATPVEAVPDELINLLQIVSASPLASAPTPQYSSWITTDNSRSRRSPSYSNVEEEEEEEFEDEEEEFEDDGLSDLVSDYESDYYEDDDDDDDDDDF